MAGALWYAFSGNAIDALMLTAGFFALLLFIMSLFFFLSLNVLLAFRTGLFVLFLVNAIAGLHLIEFNLPLGILISSALVLLYSVVSFSVSHWFAYGKIAYALDEKGISVHLQYKGKDLLVKALTRINNVNPWKAYANVAYEPRTNILRLRWHRTGVQLLLLPENPRAVIQFARKKLRH